MRSKACLALLEPMVMVLVFALAAALCLRAFALSDRLSRESERRDRAVLLAQNAAELCKAGGGDWTLLEQKLGGEARPEGWRALCGETLRPAATPEEASFVVEVRPERAEAEGLGRATVIVFAADGAELFRLPVAWQEVRHG